MNPYQTTASIFPKSTFEHSREFLESLIKDNPDNLELLKSYMKLIELQYKIEEQREKNFVEQNIKNMELTNKYQLKLLEEKVPNNPFNPYTPST